MGLLDNDQLLLGLSLMQAGSAKPVRTGLGEGLLSGLMNVQAMQDQRAQRAAQEEERKMRQAQMQMQQEQMKMQLAERQRQMQEQQGQRNYLGAMDASAGPAIEPTLPGMLARGIIPEVASALMTQSKAPEYKVVGNSLVRIGPEGVARAFKEDDKPDLNSLIVMGPDGKPTLNTMLLDAKRQIASAGASKVNVNTGDRIPTQLIKQQDELIDKITTARSTDTDLASIASQIDGGTLKFGPVRNLINTGKNIAGVSDEESRAFGTFKSTLEKLRNDSLRLNTGVQTEGDAQREWNALFQNINDSKFVGQRLQEIRKINQRAAQLHEYRLNVLRQNSGAGSLPQPQISPAIDPAPQKSGGPSLEDLLKKYGN